MARCNYCWALPWVQRKGRRKIELVIIRMDQGTWQDKKDVGDLGMVDRKKLIGGLATEIFLEWEHWGW